jgi:hypothetical protein
MAYASIQYFLSLLTKIGLNEIIYP